MPSVQLHLKYSRRVQDPQLSARVQQNKRDYRKAASMMNVLEQFPREDELNKPVPLSLEIGRSGGGSSLGNSSPKDAVNTKNLLEFESKWNKYLQERSFRDSPIEK